MIGASEPAARTARAASSAVSTVAPAASAAVFARWIVGPSASGSENATPISSPPAPPRIAANASASVSPGVGNPAVR